MPTEGDKTRPTQPYSPGNFDKIAAAVSELEHPSSIGPYSILELIGEGGMGTVYRAEQRSPVRRVVALKVIKLGMATRDAIARFESERQALAMMNHPNVASVIDAGATSDGAPYFVMEYVRGAPITDFADRQRQTVRQRLELFLQACSAVQHAHQRGIIHRDLKPSNVLVTLQDDVPRVKVIDFGVAKAIGGQLTEKTLFTQHGQLIGTPEYMAPEQATMQGSPDVDTRSDVYSLGVILYELLSGALPFETETLRSAGYEEIQRIIREVDPPRLSTRLSSLGADARRVAELRQTPLDSLARELKNELEWIPLKAMRKERTHRYTSAAAMAQDVQNYLADRPLLAGPERWSYRAHKFVRRHRASVAAMTAIAAALLAGVVATAWQAVRATRAEQGVRRALQEVQEQKRQADAANLSLAAVNQFLTNDVLGSAHLSVTRGKPLTVVEALDNAARSVKGSFAQSAATEVSVRTALADAYRSLGRLDAALPHAQAARDLAVRAVAPDDPVALNAARVLALVLLDQGKVAEAEPLMRDAIARATRAYGPGSDAALSATRDLGLILAQTDRLDEAEALSRGVLQARKAGASNENSDTIDARSALSDVLYVRGKLTECDALVRENLAACRRVLGEDHPETLTTMIDLGAVLTAAGKLGEAEANDREALRLARQVYGAEHTQTLSAVNTLAEVLQLEGKLAEAEPLFRESLNGFRAQLGPRHPSTLGVVNNLARLLNAQHKWDEAEPLYREAFEGGREIHGGLAHPNVLISALNYARALAEHQRVAEAEALNRQALDVATESLTADHRVTMALMANLGEIRHKRGDDTDAERLLRDALARRRRVLGDQNPDTLGSLHGLGKLLLDEGRYADAEPLAAELFQRTMSATMSPATAAANLSQWGICLARLGKYATAEAPLHEAYRRFDAAGIRYSDEMAGVLTALADVCDHTARATEAAHWRDELSRRIAATRSTATAPTTSPS